jgi:GNAT superfamily N-acetyltransferase
MSQIIYGREDNLDPEEFREVLIHSTLGERRPISDPERIRNMVANANLIITARHDDELIGVARSVSDFAFCTYMSDLAVDERYQKRGIGKALIEQTRLAAPETKLILLSAPKAVDYYPRIGMKRHEQCYYIDPGDGLG